MVNNLATNGVRVAHSADNAWRLNLTCGRGFRRQTDHLFVACIGQVRIPILSGGKPVQLAHAVSPAEGAVLLVLPRLAVERLHGW